MVPLRSRDDSAATTAAWFIHGVGVDITELKQAEESLQDERNVLSAILDIVGALIVVLDPMGRIVRFNRTCEQTTGYTFAEVRRQVSMGFLPVAGGSRKLSRRFLMTECRRTCQGLMRLTC